jgi:hypothetical protein
MFDFFFPIDFFSIEEKKYEKMTRLKKMKRKKK